MCLSLSHQHKYPHTCWCHMSDFNTPRLSFLGGLFLFKIHHWWNILDSNSKCILCVTASSSDKPPYSEVHDQLRPAPGRRVRSPPPSADGAEWHLQGFQLHVNIFKPDPQAESCNISWYLICIFVRHEKTNTGFLESALRHFRLLILRPSNLGLFRFRFQPVARKKRKKEICIFGECRNFGSPRTSNSGSPRAS